MWHGACVHVVQGMWYRADVRVVQGTCACGTGHVCVSLSMDGVGLSSVPVAVIGSIKGVTAETMVVCMYG